MRAEECGDTALNQGVDNERDFNLERGERRRHQHKGNQCCGKL